MLYHAHVAYNHAPCFVYGDFMFFLSELCIQSTYNMTLFKSVAKVPNTQILMLLMKCHIMYNLTANSSNTRFAFFRYPRFIELIGLNSLKWSMMSVQFITLAYTYLVLPHWMDNPRDPYIRPHGAIGRKDTDISAHTWPGMVQRDDRRLHCMDCRNLAKSGMHNGRFLCDIRMKGYNGPTGH